MYRQSLLVWNCTPREATLCYLKDRQYHMISFIIDAVHKMTLTCTTQRLYLATKNLSHKWDQETMKWTKNNTQMTITLTDTAPPWKKKKEKAETALTWATRMVDRWQLGCGSWSADAAGMMWRCYLMTCSNPALHLMDDALAEHSSVHCWVCPHTSDAPHSSLPATV